MPPNHFPVAEIFGPTVQGEGIDQGIPCHFVRFGGCDYKCEWCDTPHAVLPHMVRSLSRLTSEEIIERVATLPRSAEWIILSGGNPCLHELYDLIIGLQKCGFKVAVETQGSRWKPWLMCCDRVAVSPKPPSSSYRTDLVTLQGFLGHAPEHRTFLKVVVFDQSDYDYAKTVHLAFRKYPMFVSAGNDAGQTVGNPGRKDGRTEEQVATDLISRGRWLANRVMVDPDMADVRVQMQEHVLFWGNQKGR